MIVHIVLGKVTQCSFGNSVWIKQIPIGPSLQPLEHTDVLSVSVTLSLSLFLRTMVYTKVVGLQRGKLSPGMVGYKAMGREGLLSASRGRCEG